MQTKSYLLTKKRRRTRQGKSFSISMTECTRTRNGRTKCGMNINMNQTTVMKISKKLNYLFLII